MKIEKISIVDNLVQVISILNKMDEYLEALASGLSECDSLISDYEHFIENMNVDEVNLKKLFLDMQDNFKKRRIIKNDMALRDNYKNLQNRLNNTTNREFLIQNMKTAQSKLNTKYRNRVLTEQQEKELLIESQPKPKRGRPVKKEVITNK